MSADLTAPVPPTRGSGALAVVITRGSTPALQQIFRALHTQTLAPGGILVVDVRVPGEKAPVLRNGEVPASADLIHIRATTLGTALNKALTSQEANRRAPGQEGGYERWWILHDDTIPEPECLEELTRIADQGRTIGAVGPKQLNDDGTQLVELGIHASKDCRRLERMLPDEIDQGQYDNTTDVLAVGTAGMLLSREAWHAVGEFDSFLGPFGEGLEYGRRLHRAGYRVVAAPLARLRHTQDSYHAHRSFRRRRTAQLYNWLLATPWWSLIPLMLWLAILCPTRAIIRLSQGSPRLAADEFIAWLRLLPATGHIFASRRRNAKAATAPLSVLRPLETPIKAIKERRKLIRHVEHVATSDILDDVARRAFNDYRKTTAFYVATVALITGIVAFIGWAYSLAPLTFTWTGAPESMADLWGAAVASWIPGGDGHASPADPLAMVFAILASPAFLLGHSPHAFAVTAIWLATPLSAAAAWILASRFTYSAPRRAATALLWAGAPSLVAAQHLGILAGTLAHIALPLLLASWLSLAGLRITRHVAGADRILSVSPPPRHGALGVAAFSSAAIIAAQPLMLAILTLLVFAATPWLRKRIFVLLATLVPAAILVAPTVYVAASTQGAWPALLAVGGPLPHVEAAPAWMLALGVPASLAWAPLNWVLVATAVAFYLWALISCISARRTANSLLGRLAAFVLPSALLTVGAAWVLRNTPTRLVDATPAGTWTGIVLSAGFLALLFSGLIATRPMEAIGDAAPRRSVAAHGLLGTLTVAAALCAICALPAYLIIVPTPTTSVTPIPTDTTPSVSSTDDTTEATNDIRIVPALSAQGQASPRAGRILVLTLSADGTLNTALWRHNGDTLIDASAITRALALYHAQTATWDDATRELASLALTLTTYPDITTARALATHAVDTILIPTDQSMPAQVEALNRAPGLERVGTTSAGHLWRLRADGTQPARVTLVTNDAAAPLNASDITVDTQLEYAGQIVLAERANAGWKASLNGVALTAHPQGWQQRFDAPNSGHVRIWHTAWWLYPWWAACALSFTWALIALVPTRRTQ
ncbi:glycosyltransferase [Schaalia suimastitidis]|uniref:glycosyltransferase n=1 Tax=Schaalia suimastitidis TaxID=121163 RepID=UPI000423611A|nr:glycosyltransferase [Schaalia suimastitidis]